ncbi:MAG TPA: class IV adenylate cyclase [Spirochaetota bacterium]|nr:class IV adenylate cyclase [Spirochaetota bacterium]HPI90135.1 class IV adenylate cyclase [Spirochaetota bacterium]HPR49149.1 class IV adenylate cyclase [Spirochaetota bacterium]
MELLEIEIKAYCEDGTAAETRIMELGGVFIEARREEDIYFNHPCRDFRITDEALRLRGVGGSTVLTYKGPKLGGRSKTRVEQEADIPDRAAVKAILTSLGFVESGRVAKERKLYHLHDVEICLDRVEGLGLFIELEKKDTDREKVEAVLFSLAEELGLTRFERRSYLELILDAAPL